MKLENLRYYHFYNRTINNEIAFQENENYLYFLDKYRKYIVPHVTTVAYCLLPTHFHFLIKIQTNHIPTLTKNIGIFLSSYSKAINKSRQRHGSLFQQHSKAILVDDEKYLLTLVNYIHQNPIRAKLIKELESWPYSSYPDLSGKRNGTLPCREIVDSYFKSSDEFIAYSQIFLDHVKEKYWV